MSEVHDCAFCNPEELDWRTVRHSEFSRSFVSNPRFRSGQVLVIPNRHITEVGELTLEEGGDILLELGRLAAKLDGGFGSGIMQKFQPLQSENGIKMNHLHLHVFPRLENERGQLFPVPVPNDFDGFARASNEEIVQLAEALK